MVSKETVVLRRWEIGASFFKGVAIIVASAKQEGLLRAYRAPVAQLVEHRAVTREVVSSTPAGPTLRVLK